VFQDSRFSELQYRFTVILVLDQFGESTLRLEIDLIATEKETLEEVMGPCPSTTFLLALTNLVWAVQNLVNA
jgi:hypothetical protein